MNFFIEIESCGNLPLYKRVANALKDSIDSGRLQQGQAVPSTRQLAVHLGVSRITVVQSYQQLVSQGYLRVETGNGTFVSESCQPAAIERKPDETLLGEASSNSFDQPASKIISHYGSRLLEMQNQTQDSTRCETKFGLPPTALLPLKQWQKLLSKYCYSDSNQRLKDLADPLGCRPLREALAQYLRRSRNINCTAENIAVFASAQQSVSLILHLLLNSGDKIAVENPGFIGARRSICSIGAQPIAINVDSNGMIVSDLINCPEKCRVVYVTPNRQDPLAVSLSEERRHELLKWATVNNAYIIEDDYDCEFNYSSDRNSGVATQAIKSQDRNESVVYLSSFWKLLYPIMPIGFLVAPSHLIPAIAQAKQLSEHTFSIPEQLALAEFINEGLLERHISKNQKQLAQRRQQLISALCLAFGQAITISKHSAGMHIIVQIKLALSDELVSKAANQVGLPLISSKTYYLANSKEGEFLISFTGSDNQNLAELVEKFAALITEAL